MARGGAAWVEAQTINGCPVGNATVPRAHLRRAAPERDSIPALDRPRFLATAEIVGMAAEDQVFVVERAGEARAYPLRVLGWHEMVNDRLGEEPVTVTFSALTGTALAFSDTGAGPGAGVGFGVSGVLYNSGLLFYDRATASLWSQMPGRALSGPRAGEELVPVPGVLMTWSGWRAKYPAGRVMWPETDRDEDYRGDWPYEDYATQAATLFPFDINRDDFTTKVRMIGLAVGDRARAWPEEKLAGRAPFFDTVGSTQVRVIPGDPASSTEVRDLTTGKLLPAMSVYWFAWQAFYPDTSVWMPLE